MRKIIPSLNISKKELWFVLILAVLASFFSLAPTIWAYLKTPAGFWFTGFHFLHDPWDVNVYLSAVREGWKGHWFYQNPYDPLSGAGPIPIYFVYIILGHLARLFSISVALTYHLASFFLTIGLFYMLYLFLAFYFREKRWRFFTLLLITFGGGAGWLAYPKGIYLADISFPDGTFFQILHLPHFVLNQILFLASLLFSFWAFSFKNRRLAWLGALSGFLLAFLHPYSLLTVILILLGFIMVLILAGKKPSGVFYLLPSFVVWVLTLMFFYLFLRQTPYMARVTFPPPPLYFVLSYIFFVPFIIWGAISFWREKEEKTLFLFSWLIVHFSVIYFPSSFHRLAIKGYFIILCISAVWGLKKLGVYVKRPWPIYLLFLFFSVLTQVLIFYLLVSPSYYMKSSNRWAYLTYDEKQAFDFLLKNSKKEEVVLASYIIGSALPVHTNNRVYFGHDVSIFNWRERRKNLSDFFSGQLSSPSQFLKNEKIDYVFWGPEEKKLGDFDLTRQSYLENIYQNDKVILFKVK